MQLIGELVSSFQPYHNLASGLHYARLYGNFNMHFTMDIKAIGRKLVEAERMIQDWKSSFKILLGDKLVEDGKRNR